MEYDKMPYDYLIKNSNLLSNESIQVSSQIRARENYIARRLQDERLIQYGYDFDGVRDYSWKGNEKDHVIFAFSRESGYESYEDTFNVPKSVLDDVSTLDEWLKPHLVLRDKQEAETEYAKVKKEYNAQLKKLEEFKKLHPNVKFDE